MRRLELKNEKDNVRSFWLDIVRDLKPGVTELHIHAAIAGDEVKAITGSWKTRSEAFEIFTHDEEMKRLVADSHFKLTSYRALRDLQRKARGQAKGD
jgi:chitin disaccharide deacetylase